MTKCAPRSEVQHLSAEQVSRIRRELREIPLDTVEWGKATRRLHRHYGVDWDVIDRIGRWARMQWYRDYALGGRL
jgi:hypothetical protein